MPAPLHPEAKKIILQLCKFFTPKEVAYWLDFHPEMIYRVCRQFKNTGDVANKARTGRTSSLPSEVLLYIVRRTRISPDIYLSELQERVYYKLNHLVSTSTICRILSKQGLYVKQLAKTAIERDEYKRTRFWMDMAQFRADQLAFADESGMELRQTFRKYGRGERGERVRKKANFVRGTKYSILPALGLMGPFHVVVVKGSVTGDIFEEFLIETMRRMKPYPLPRSVLVIDNAAIHRNEVLEEIARERGAKLVYLPAYSPDFNPIEEGFSAMKAWVRRYGSDVRRVLSQKSTKPAKKLLKKAVYTAMKYPKPIGWYAHSGYCGKHDYSRTEEVLET